MKKKWIWVIVIALVILVGASSCVGRYNQLVTLNESVDTAWAQVENVLQRRNDLIPNLVNTVKGYAGHEKETFIAVTEARAKVGQAQAQSDYYYRHASVALLTGKPKTLHIKLSDLGQNSKAQPIAALAADVQFLAHPSLASFQVKTRTNHQRAASNILFAAGNVTTVSNRDDKLTVNIGTSPYDALEKILAMFELADDYR